METVSINNGARFAADINSAIRQWFRFTNEAAEEVAKISQPLLDAYLKGLGAVAPQYETVLETALGKVLKTDLQEFDLKSINDLYCRKNCDIPETECPPYCVCEMEWDACEGETVTGSIAIKNTGQQTASFSINADSFKSASNDDSGITPQFTPSTFGIAPNGTQTVSVSIKVEGNFDSSITYASQAKVRGRYEQCVLLKLRIRRKSAPSCSVEQGEIPKRIVAHNWYDHFQCEELCFEPVGRTFVNSDGNTVVVVDDVANVVRESVVKEKVTTKKAATVGRPKATTRKAATKKAAIGKKGTTRKKKT